MLIEEQSLRILTDPGWYSDAQDTLRDLDVVIITHEHGDHLDLLSLKRVLGNNPNVKILANPSVCAFLEKESIHAKRFEDGVCFEEKGVRIEGVGTYHAFLHPSISPILNTGYIIADNLYYPGDAFTVPPRPIEILALPVAGPWMRLAEGIDFARALKPKVCFPVHEAILKAPGLTHELPPKILEPEGIRFLVPELGVPFEL